MLRQREVIIAVMDLNLRIGNGADSGHCLVQPPIPKGFTRQLFGGLYDKPLCSLYAPSNTTGFTGHCDTDLPQQCTYPRKWCGQDEGRSNAGSDLVEELMALQVAKVGPFTSFPSWRRLLPPFQKTAFPLLHGPPTHIHAWAACQNSAPTPVSGVARMRAVPMQASTLLELMALQVAKVPLRPPPPLPPKHRAGSCARVIEQLMAL